MREITLGEIRKDVETKLHRRFLKLRIMPTENQTIKIRELAPEIAEGKLNINDAFAEIRMVL